MKQSIQYGIVWLLGIALMSPLFGWSQGLATGTVSDENGMPLPGATVVVEETNAGTTTDFDGNYQILASSGQTLVFSYVGYESQSVAVGTSSSMDVQLQPANELEEVVLTGVATGTSTRKLGFTVSKISEQSLQDVPASDPGNALRAKVTGIRVVQASGNPTSAPEIRLRGSTSISGNQSPLYIIDGIMLEGGTREINVEDIESVEVVKGAAGSSLYGSLAGNGVVQYFTYRGKGVSELKVSLRNSFGWSALPSEYPISKRHNYVMSNGKFTFNEAEQLQNETDGLKDNMYPTYHDNLKEVLTSQPTLTNYVSLSKSAENFNFHASAQNTEVGGLIKSLPPYKRKNFRLNTDYHEGKFDFEASVSYATSDGFSVQEQGQGANFFYSILISEPFVDLTEKDSEGKFKSSPTGYNWGGSSNIQNPLYIGNVVKFDLDTERLLGRFAFNYKLSNNLRFSFSQSIDRIGDYRCHIL